MRANTGKRGLALLLAICLAVGMASAATPLDPADGTPAVETATPLDAAEETPAVEAAPAAPLSMEDGTNTWIATLDGIQGTPGATDYGSPAVIAQTPAELPVETGVPDVKLFLGGAWRNGGSNQYHLEYEPVTGGIPVLSGTLGARKADGLAYATTADPVPEIGTYFRWEIAADGILEFKGVSSGYDKVLLVTRNGELVTPDYLTQYSEKSILLELGLSVSAGDVVTICLGGGRLDMCGFAFTHSNGETIPKKDAAWTVEGICGDDPFLLNVTSYDGGVSATVTGPFVGWRLNADDVLAYQHCADEVVLECYNSKGELVSASSLTRSGRSHPFTFNLDASDVYTFKALAKRDGEAVALESEPVVVDCTGPLGQPKLFTVSSAGGGAMTVRWYKATGADSYNVYYSLDGSVWLPANPAPIPAADKSILEYTVSGLEVGTGYTFKVEAAQSTTGQITASLPMSAIAKPIAEPGWAFQYFGESTSPSRNYYSGDLNNDGNVRLVAGDFSADNPTPGGKLIPKRLDGIGFYYTPIPAGTNWTLRAKVHVNRWYADHNEQSGVGIGVYDRVPSAPTKDKYWNNSFVAAAGNYGYEGRKLHATLSVARYGVPKNYTNVTVNPPTFVSRISPLDLRFMEDPALPHARCNTVGNRRTPAVVQEVDSYYENPQYMYTDFIFEVQKNNTGYIARQYDAETGELLRENIEYFVNGVHEMSGTDIDARSEVSEPTHAAALDPDYEYVGLFTARVMDATFSDVTLDTVAPEDDAPAERPPIPTAVTHTATFMVGDKVIDRVAFDEGAAALEEPALPVRENYIGAWEPYDLAAATGDITVHGHYTPIDPNRTSDLDAGADATYENGTATITLNASAASKTIKVMTETVAPADVVLVLDQSGSMKETLSVRDRQSKRDALVDCADRFVRSLYDNAVKTGAEHRVAVVGFSCSEYNRGTQYNPKGYNNTGLLTTPDGKSVNYRDLKDADYKTALLPIRSGDAINPNITAGLHSIVADGATAADLGLAMAQNIFAENPTSGNRQRVVIFITDGTPTAWGETASRITPTAADAISTADHIKNGQDAKIYSVGVHADADATADFTGAKDGVTTDRWGSFAGYDFNRFLHAVSSNYPSAKSMSNLGDGDRAGGYYMAVTDTSNLQSIFNNILYNTVYELKRFDKVTFHYTLPAEFTLTIEQEMALRQDLRTQFGVTDADILVDRNSDGTTGLQLRNIPTQEAYDDSGALVYQATVSFQASANELASGAVSAGSGGAGYGEIVSTEFDAPAVTVPVSRNLLVFTIGSQVYQIKEAQLGDAVVVPESRLAIWELEDPNTVVTGDYAVFKSSRSDVSYAVNWVMGDTRTLQYYRFGDTVTPPDAAPYAPDGYEFSGWSSNIPATMPAYDVTCTAIYSPAHVHSFAKAYQTGTCTEGIVTVYRCPCGEEKSEQAPSEPHNYTAVFSDNGSAGNTVSKLACTKCGHSQEQNLTFKVAYSKGWRTTVLDLSLYQSEVSVTQPDEDVEIRFYIGEDDGRTYTITRIDADGTKTSYRGKAEDGYLVFKADHFSIYVVGDADASSAPDEDVSFQQAVDILDSKEEVTTAEPPEHRSILTGALGSSKEFSWSVDADGVLTLTPAQGVTPDSGDTVFAATWDQNGSFLGAQLLSGITRSATVQLQEGWHTMKLIWTDRVQTPYCPAAAVSKP